LHHARGQWSEPGLSVRYLECHHRSHRLCSEGLSVRPLDAFSRRIVSLTVEGPWVRIVGTHRQVVEYWADIPFDSDWLRSGVIAATNELGQLIGTTFRMQGIRRNRVVAA